MTQKEEKDQQNCSHPLDDDSQGAQPFPSDPHFSHEDIEKEGGDDSARDEPDGDAPLIILTSHEDSNDHRRRSSSYHHNDDHVTGFFLIHLMPPFGISNNNTHINHPMVHYVDDTNLYQNVLKGKIRIINKGQEQFPALLMTADLPFHPEGEKSSSKPSNREKTREGDDGTLQEEFDDEEDNDDVKVLHPFFLDMKRKQQQKLEKKYHQPKQEMEEDDLDERLNIYNNRKRYNGSPSQKVMMRGKEDDGMNGGKINERSRDELFNQEQLRFGMRKIMMDERRQKEEQMEKRRKKTISPSSIRSGQVDHNHSWDSDSLMENYHHHDMMSRGEAEKRKYELIENRRDHQPHDHHNHLQLQQQQRIFNHRMTDEKEKREHQHLHVKHPTEVQVFKSITSSTQIAPNSPSTFPSRRPFPIFPSATPSSVPATELSSSFDDDEKRNRREKQKRTENSHYLSATGSGAAAIMMRRISSGSTPFILFSSDRTFTSSSNSTSASTVSNGQRLSSSSHNEPVEDEETRQKTILSSSPYSSRDYIHSLDSPHAIKRGMMFDLKSGGDNPQLPVPIAPEVEGQRGKKKTERSTTHYSTPLSGFL